ncbi:caspase family protein, partial [Alphaproteobacteria bacterium]|nr:caspase family protein [Alphaproteobacteria bacterium]
MARLFSRVVIYSFFALLIITPLKAKPSDKSKIKQNKYGIALIIGNKNYKDGVPPVDYAHNDAEAFKRYVTDILRFRERNIIYLRDATKAKLDSALGTHNNVEGEVQSFVREGKSDVIIYYSGHGVPGVKSKRGLLLPTDATSNNAELVGYPIDQLYKNLSKIGAKSVTVFLEACFSGGSEGGMLIKNASPVFTRIEAPKSNLGVTILSATSKAQLASWDTKTKHGMFTNYLL